MTVDIVVAKSELFNKFKRYAEVVGAGIKGRTGKEFIVIFLSKPNHELINLIPTQYKGNKVTTEISSKAKAL